MVPIGFTKPKRYVDQVFLHCSASDVPAHDNLETIRRWHLDRGWRDVGYHYFIRKDGTLERGRDIEFPAPRLGITRVQSPSACQEGRTGAISLPTRSGSRCVVSPVPSVRPTTARFAFVVTKRLPTRTARSLPTANGWIWMRRATWPSRQNL